MTTSRKTSRARTATSREEDTMMLHGVAAHIVKLEREKAITPLMKVYKELLSQIQGPGYADVRDVLHTWVCEYLLKEMDITEDLSHLNLQELGIMMENKVEEWKKMYLSQGKARGRAEGRAEKEQQIFLAQKKRIIELLESRFGSVPPNLLASIEVVTDANVLIDFAVFAATTNSLQDIELQSSKLGLGDGKH